MTIQVSGLADFGWSPFFQSQLLADESTHALPARVIAVHRGRLELRGPGLDLGIPAPAQPVAVGDWLLVDPGSQRAVRLLERKSLFRRMAAGTSHAQQLIAANVDTVFVVTSCNQDFNVARLERYVALAREAQVTPVIVLTKSDLSQAPEEFVRAASKVRAGVLVEALNALEPGEVARLAPWCEPGQTVALLGSSGVGKSTLIGTLAGRNLATQPAREHDDRGRHTTTRRELFRLPAGGWLLDTPGMRELQLTEAGAGLADVFAEIEDAASRCRFGDCRHQSEPGCAVTEGIERGIIDAGRLRRWRKLLAENARNRQSVADRRAEDRRFGKQARRSFEAKRARREPG
jgi:ribosome biogenesis GTPase